MGGASWILSTIKEFNIETGSEIFGSPIILSTGIVFIAGTDDKKLEHILLIMVKNCGKTNYPFLLTEV